MIIQKKASDGTFKQVTYAMHVADPQPGDDYGFTFDAYGTDRKTDEPVVYRFVMAYDEYIRLHDAVARLAATTNGE